MSSARAWHELIDKPKNEVTEEDRRMLDEIAEATCNVDLHFNALRDLYNETPYGQTVQGRVTLTRSVQAVPG